MSTTTTQNQAVLFVKMGTDAWKSQNKRISDLLELVSDAQLENETAPGRNTGTYILGHLVAVNDRLIETMGWGPRLFPELDEPFLFKPDHSGLERPGAAELRAHWVHVNDAIDGYMAVMETEDWFTRHNSVTEADFANEPHRNKLNLLLSRTIHASNHQGQLNYLKSKVHE